MRSHRPLAVAWTLAILLAAGVAGQQPEDGPALGEPTVLAVHPALPHVVYAGFAGFGLFRSADGGETWERLDADLPGARITDLALDPFHPGTLYALEAGHGLFKSDDDGLSWRPVGAGLPRAVEVRDVAADPDEPFSLYAATRFGVFRSVDGAASFELVGSLPGPVQVLFHPRDVVPVYALTADALFVSADFGLTWIELGPIGETARSVAIDPSNPKTIVAATGDGVLVSVDGGRSWASAGLRLAVRQVVFDAHGGLLAVTDEGVFRLSGDPRSGDRGWRQLTSSPARALAVDAFQPAAFFVADGEAQVLRTHDDGRSTTRVLRAAVPPPASLGRRPPREKEPPLPLRLARAARPDDPVAALAVHPDRPDVIYAAGAHGVFLGVGHGRRWTPVSAGLELLDVHALAVDPENPATLYAGTHGAGLFRSTDGGRSWRPSRRGLGMAAVAAVTVDPLEPSVVYAGGRAGLFTSRDHGGSWTALAPDDEVRALEYLAVDPLELAAGTASGRVLAWSVVADAGAPGGVVALARERVTDEVDAYAVDPAALEIRDLAVAPADRRLYVATAFGLWTSADAGRSWTPFELSFNATAVAVDPLAPEVLWVGTTEGLFRHAGGRWSRIKVPGVDREAAVYSVAAAPEPPASVIYAGLADGRVAASSDSGATWAVAPLREEPPPPVASGVATSRAPPTSRALARRLTLFLEETPPSAVRRRALLAMERAARSGDGDESEVYEELAGLVEEVLELQSRRGDERLHDLRFSDDSRWLAAELRFDDGRRGHSELRLYDLEGPRPRPGGPDLYGYGLLRKKLLPLTPPPWRALADVAREPVHLHPSWVIADGGTVLSWSPRGRFLATRADADRLSVWRVAAPPRDEASRHEPRTPAVPREQRLALAAPGVDFVAWSPGDRHLAVAGPRDLEREAFAVLLADLERPPKGELRPTRVGFEEKVTELRFTPEGRWLWIRADADARWALLVPRAGRWTLLFERVGETWRVAPQTRLRHPFAGAPDAFAELAASPDGRWLAGRPAADDGAPRAEVLLWSLGPGGPDGEPRAIAATGPDPPRFSADSRCFGLDGGARWLLDLGDEDCRLRGPVWGTAGGLVWPRAEAPEPYAVDDGEVAATIGWRCGGCRGPRIGVLRRGERGWERVTLPAPEEGIEHRSPDRRWVAMAAEAGKGVWSPVVELWDVEARIPAGLRARIGRFGMHELHPDEGARELAGRAVVYWAPPERRHPRGNEALDRACRVLGRNLTEAEWRRYAGDAPYEPVCEFVRAEPTDRR